jgi:hypothetical protein
MNFIERLLGVSPDGGSGSLEFLLLIVPGVLIQLGRVAARWSMRRRHS